MGRAAWVLVVVGLGACAPPDDGTAPVVFDDEERARLQRLGPLPPVPPSPTNAVADDPRSVISEQVELGVAVRMAVLEALARNLPNP